MVVTRKQSVNPIPAVASRTSSSTGTPRSSKGKGIDKGSPLEEESTAGSNHIPPNGTTSIPPQVDPKQVDDIRFDDDSSSPKYTKPPRSKSKSKSKTKKSPKSKKQNSPKGISAFDIIARLFLLWLTIYTLSVCPEDVELRSPVCHALAEYRRIVLEPYVYPPIRAALDHPAIAPHIQRVQPYYNRAARVSTPWIRLCKREWRKRVVPQLQRVQYRARPYILRVERQYDLIIGPYARQASDALVRYRRQAEPYVIAFLLKSGESWNVAKPYFIPLWRKAAHIPGIVTMYVGRPLDLAKKQWVDPQVIKIWNAVVEQGKADGSIVPIASTKSASSTSAVSSTSSMILPTSMEDVSQIISVTPDSISPVPELTYEAVVSASSIVTTTSVSVTTESPKITSVLGDDTPGPSSEAVSFVAPPVPEQTDAAAQSASSIIRQSEGFSPSNPATTPTPSHPPTPSSDIRMRDVDLEDADDLEIFLAELDLDSEPSEPPEPTPQASEAHEESEEERQERLRRQEIETAEKRADIERRHTQWEIDLDKFGRSQRKVARNTLKRLRDAASEEARISGGPVRGPIETLVAAAEKSLKSLKAYARKLADEDKSETEKVSMWEKVADRVDKKFGEQVDASAESVKQWWSAYNQQEQGEIAQISHAVMVLADKAQEDIALDYSWLADVTYDDWQRYHKLMYTGKDFRDLYFGMQNGSALNAPPNPVAEIIEAIQEEVDDMILGFETDLSMIKTAAIDSFSTSTRHAGASSVTTDFSSDVEKEPAAKPAAVVTDSEPGHDVSILPIDAESTAAFGIPPVILSRGAKEVESAISRAEEAEAEAHTEL